MPSIYITSPPAGVPEDPASTAALVAKAQREARRRYRLPADHPPLSVTDRPPFPVTFQPRKMRPLDTSFFEGISEQAKANLQMVYDRPPLSFLRPGGVLVARRDAGFENLDEDPGKVVLADVITAELLEAHGIVDDSIVIVTTDADEAELGVLSLRQRDQATLYRVGPGMCGSSTCSAIASVKV